jgi:SAM-dependent methyltransferase
MSQVRDVWQANLPEELRFWDKYLSTRGHLWPQEFAARIDPDAPLIEKEIVTRIRPGTSVVRILDVGAGPLTILGKRLPGVTLEITAVDPLANDYNKLLQLHEIVPPVRTEWCEGEGLAERFARDTFDFAYARNALDHAHDPAAVIQQMVTITKPGGWVILRHRPNEAESAKYEGLHQWNFELRKGKWFWIRGKAKSYDMPNLLKWTAEVHCHMDGQWLICAIRKRTGWQRLLRRLRLRRR